MRLSLRARIFLILIMPLIFVSLVALSARYYVSERLVARIYDNTLLTIAHTISRDVLLSEGDLLTENLLGELRRTLGDTLYYRVSAGEGGFITGYSRQPTVPSGVKLDKSAPTFYDSYYQGLPVRVLTFQEDLHDAQFSGLSTVTVWQTINQRNFLSRQLAGQSAMLLAGVIGAAAVLLWFGIQVGLRPLLELRDAIGQRSPDDLRPIKRWIPPELKPLVDTVNTLFDRLARAFSHRDAFIADAAHQIRNPIAALQSQAEAARTAKTETELRKRVADLAFTARKAGRLTNQLLSLERVRGRTLKSQFAPLDLVGLIQNKVTEIAERLLPRNMEVDFAVFGTVRPVVGDHILLTEVIVNLLDNAEQYGMRAGGKLVVTVSFQGKFVEIIVCDDGPGIPEEMRERVFDRFFRLEEEDESGGCGLGLAIAFDAIAAHGGKIVCNQTPRGTEISATIPLSGKATL